MLTLLNHRRIRAMSGCQSLLLRFKVESISQRSVTGGANSCAAGLIELWVRNVGSHSWSLQEKEEWEQSREQELAVKLGEEGNESLLYEHALQPCWKNQDLQLRPSFQTNLRYCVSRVNIQEINRRPEIIKNLKGFWFCIRHRLCLIHKVNGTKDMLVQRYRRVKEVWEF